MTSKLLTLRGAPALSAFRIQKVRDQIDKALGGNAVLGSIVVEFVHFVSCAESLTATEQGVLDRLLEYGEAGSPVVSAGQLFLITPRPGTISPWSSKATDIAHNCGDYGIAFKGALFFHVHCTYCHDLITIY